jgi:multicomponent Na+:H+ antiporter subunit G
MEMIKTAVELLFALLILMGALLSAVSAIGLIRLPDVYLRSHAAAKSATLGVLCVLSGAFLYFAFFLDFISVKLLLGIVFVFMTSPVSAHLTGRAAYRTGVPLWKRRIQDDLKEVLEKEKIEPVTPERDKARV